MKSPMEQLIDLEEIIDHKIVRQFPLPSHSSSMYEYLFAANGVFIRGIRPGLEVLMPVECYRQNLQGLPSISPYLQISPSRIPKTMMLEIWRKSCMACNPHQLDEIAFHIHHQQSEWHLEIPEQTQSSVSCQPTQDDGASSFYNATIDLHSHHSMKAFFSNIDDADEGGFRIYAVLGRVNTQPEIRVRVGLFRHFWEVPAFLIFELPDFMLDLSSHPKFAYQFYRNTYLLET
jgi:PRTRC genetic system protein A